jgi:hypothetical protein
MDGAFQPETMADWLVSSARVDTLRRPVISGVAHALWGILPHSFAENEWSITSLS